MVAILRVSPPTVERRGSDNRVSVRFKLNRPPDAAWIDLFKAHAASSALRATNPVVHGGDVYLEIGKVSGDAEIATALDCFIECANLRLRSFPASADHGRLAAPGRRPPAWPGRRAG